MPSWPTAAHMLLSTGTCVGGALVEQSLRLAFGGRVADFGGLTKFGFGRILHRRFGHVGSESLQSARPPAAGADTLRRSRRSALGTASAGGWHGRLRKL